MRAHAHIYRARNITSLNETFRIIAAICCGSRYHGERKLRTIDVGRFALYGPVYYWYYTWSHVLRRRIETGGLRVSYAQSAGFKGRVARSRVCSGWLRDHTEILNTMDNLKTSIFYTGNTHQCTQNCIETSIGLQVIFFWKNNIDSEKML